MAPVCFTEPWLPWGCHGNTPWEAALTLGEWIESAGQSDPAKRTEGQVGSQWRHTIAEAFTCCNLSLQLDEQLWGICRQASLSVFTSLSFQMLLLHFESSLSASMSLWLRWKHPGSSSSRFLGYNKHIWFSFLSPIETWRSEVFLLLWVGII